ncbi:MAG: hypothetical protein HY926_05400 [Elusimicrobia bacterium]|nr:hypothetical protein [Elusimicrobiota bacterium]
MGPGKPAIAAILMLAVNAAFLLGVLLASRPQEPGFSGPEWGVTGGAVRAEDIPGYLAGLAAMRSLPEDAAIQLRFYRAAPGMRVQEKSYVIGRDVAEGEAPDADLEVLLDARYVAELGGGICPAIQRARAEKGLEFKVRKNAGALLWKYRDIARYKACFGF